ELGRRALLAGERVAGGADPRRLDDVAVDHAAGRLHPAPPARLALGLALLVARVDLLHRRGDPREDLAHRRGRLVPLLLERLVRPRVGTVPDAEAVALLLETGELLVHVRGRRVRVGDRLRQRRVRDLDEVFGSLAHLVTPASG